MIRRIVSLALSMPMWAFGLAAVIALAGLRAWRALDIEAYPDPVAPLVEVIAQPPGWAAEEVERSVTVPLEIALAGMPGLDHLRSQSIFGLSDVKAYFRWGTDYRWDRQQVLDRLQLVQLPGNIQPQLSPENPIGEIYRYTVQGPYSLTDLKTAEDWILEPQFKQVPGVIDVAGFGGLTKQYQVLVDPDRLWAEGLPLSQLAAALQNGNQNVGGNVLPLGEQSFNVRGIGLIRGVADVRNTVVGLVNKVPVRVGDVAQVRLGHATRLGKVGKDGDDDVVEGIVLMRKGGNTLQTLAGVEKKVEEIRRYHLLPRGMEVVPYYDRTRLVHLTTHTVLHNLLLGMALVVVVLLLFFGTDSCSARAALITALTIPLALLFSFTCMVASGTPANLISLGAVDFGIIVDSTVILMERVFHHLSLAGSATARDRVLAAAGEVGGPMLFSTLIIGVAFLPLFVLRGVEGVIFSPMAHTYAFAILGAAILAVTLAPALAVHLPCGAGEKETKWVELLRRAYEPLFTLAVRRPGRTALLCLAPVAAALCLFPLLGGEFMPKLEEGNFWVRATLPTSISLAQAAAYATRMRAVFLRHPEVKACVSQLGRPDDGTDVAGFNNVEFFVPLKNFDHWEPGMDKARLTRILAGQLRRAFPGVDFNFSQNIEDNVEEAMSGVKGENSVKVVGPHLRVDQKLAAEVARRLSQVRGITDVGMFPVLGQPDVEIVPDRRACARYGLNVGDVEAVIQAAVGGQAVTQVLEGEKRFDLVVRYAPAFRKNISDLRQVVVNTPGGAQIPLGQVAKVQRADGPSTIYREDNHRYVPVKFSVRGRDLASAVREARARLASLPIPWDTHLEWSGEINELAQALRRLRFVIPVTLLLIAFLVFSAVKSGRDALVVFAQLPVACAGGVLALLATGIPFSISAAMGFVSIFGIAIQDGLLTVNHAQRLWSQGLGVEGGAQEAARRAFRSAMMTTLVAMIGLLPAALSRAIGSQTQRPLAVVVIGGALSIALLPRLLQPALLVLLHRGDGGTGVQGSGRLLAPPDAAA